MIPELQAVKSSNVASLGFSEAGMFVEYKSGKVYKHAGVSKEQYDAVLGSSSVGKAVIAMAKSTPGLAV